MRSGEFRLQKIPNFRLSDSQNFERTRQPALFFGPHLVWRNGIAAFTAPSEEYQTDSIQVFILGINFHEARLVRVHPPPPSNPPPPPSTYKITPENTPILLRHRPPSLRAPPRPSPHPPHSAPGLPQQPKGPRHNSRIIEHEDRKRFAERAEGEH